MRKLLLTLGIINLFFFSAFARADEKAFTERKGFVIGADAGIGYEYYSRAQEKGLSFGLGSIKVGGGLSEKILLLAELGYSQGSKDELPSLLLGYISSQIFLHNAWYVRPGVGFAFGQVEPSAGPKKEDKYGFSSTIAGGYEFRLTKRFALSPELQLRYTRFEGGNVITPGVYADFRWYF